jgi:structural maintenance of chromosome 1
VLTSSVGGSEDDDTSGETLFKRTIIGDNTSEYRIDGKKVTEKEYQAKLKSIGLLVKSRNFLVFQNEVTKVAQKSPKELTELIERVSGSEVRPPGLSPPSREALECPTRSTVLSHIARARECRGAACFPAVCDPSGWGFRPNTR